VVDETNNTLRSIKRKNGEGIQDGKYLQCKVSLKLWTNLNVIKATRNVSIMNIVEDALNTYMALGKALSHKNPVSPPFKRLAVKCTADLFDRVSNYRHTRKNISLQTLLEDALQDYVSTELSRH
jgi:hypothetical protein